MALNCPHDSTPLTIRDVELCPTCEGIWFDRGEVEKLMALHRSRQGDSGGGTDGGDLADIADLALSFLDLFQ